MGIRIFKRDNWSRWEDGFFGYGDFRKLDPEKDRLLLAYMLSRCDEGKRTRVTEKLGITEVPALPVNVDDEDDERYAPYLVMQEQVMREEDYWTLREAAFEAPGPMRRFAFCRLTGYSWPPDECDAYSYRTYSCGLKSGLTREDIECFCREMIDNRGPFAAEAGEWLKKLPGVSDEELAARAE